LDRLYHGESAEAEKYGASIPLNSKAGEAKKTLKLDRPAHLWLGLASGIVYSSSALQVVFCFSKRISEAVWKEKYFVSPPGVPARPFRKCAATEGTGCIGAGKPINDITIHRLADRSWNSWRIAQ